MTPSGTKHPEMFCPISLRTLAPELYAQKLKNMQESIRSKILAKDAWCVVDYEPYTQGWVTQTCFCKNCIAEFAKFAGLATGNMSAKEILTNHEKQWVEFRCKQRADIVREMTVALKRFNPKAKFLFCSMPMPGYGEENAYLREFGIDLRLYEEFVDIHTPMSYEPNVLFYKRLLHGVELLQKPLMPILSSGWGGSRIEDPGMLRLHALTVGLMNCPGIIYFAGLDAMDGGLMAAHKEALNLIVSFAEYRENGKLNMERVVVKPGFNAADNTFYVARSLEDKTLLLALNDSKNSVAYVKIILPKCDDGDYTVREIGSGRIWSPDGKRRIFSGEELRAGIVSKLSPFGFALLEILPGQPPKETQIACDASEAARGEAREQSDFQNRMALKKQHGMSAGITGENGKPVYFITTPTQRLAVDLGKGATARWECKNDNIWSEAASTIGNDLFVLPRSFGANQCTAELTGITIHADQAEASFRYKITEKPFDGLAVEKTYTVWRDRPEIKISLAVIPEGGYRPFTFRASQIVTAGLEVSKKSGQPLSAFSEYEIPGINGNIVEVGNNRSVTYPRDGIMFPSGTPHMKLIDKAAEVKSGFSGDWLAFRNTKTGERITVDFASVEELFFWRQGDTVTMEWIYQSAYPDNDPHKMATWQTDYTLKYEKH